MAPETHAGTSHKGDFEQTLPKEEVRNNFCAFLHKNYGSAARAWRSVLDPLGHGELLLWEFMQGLARTTWRGNTPALWSAISRRAMETDGEDGQVLVLGSIDPEANKCLEEFRTWTAEKWGGPIEMLTKLAKRANRSMYLEEFLQACNEHGFECDASIVAHTMDLDDDGLLGVRDAAYFETNALKRRTYLDPDFVMGLEHARKVADKWRHRRQLQKQVSDAALKEFHHKVRAASGGSLIRGWRRILDIYGNLSVSKIELLKGCRKMAFSGNVSALWKALDVDDDGAVQLEDVDPRLAFVLSFFRKWAAEQHGSCTKAMHYMACLLQRRHPKWTQQDLIVALHLAKFPGVPQVSLRQVSGILHEAMDVGNLGYVTVQDAEFLDRWEPTPWLQATPDPEGKVAFINALRERALLLKLGGGLAEAIGQVSNNRVFYKDFRDTCRLLECGNPPGIWRCFYKGVGAGYITLADVDRPSAAALMKFKTWAESTFGGIVQAFRSFDIQRNGELSYPEFRRALRKYGYEGDAKMLFLSLKPAGAQSYRINKDARLTAGDLKYLALWECGEGDDNAPWVTGSEELPEPSSPSAVRATTSLPALPVSPSVGPDHHDEAPAGMEADEDDMLGPPEAQEFSSDSEGPAEVAHAPVEVMEDSRSSSSTHHEDDEIKPLPKPKPVKGAMRINRTMTPFWDENRGPDERPRPTMNRAVSIRVDGEGSPQSRTSSLARSGSMARSASRPSELSMRSGSKLSLSGSCELGSYTQLPSKRVSDESLASRASKSSTNLSVVIVEDPSYHRESSQPMMTRNMSVMGHRGSLPALHSLDEDDMDETKEDGASSSSQKSRGDSFLPPLAKKFQATKPAPTTPNVRDFLSYCKTSSELKFVTYNRPPTDCSFSLGSLLDDSFAKSSSSWMSSDVGSSQDRPRLKSPYRELPVGLEPRFTVRVGALGLSTTSVGW
eukprot:CAMPEP_0178381532 /NCGR_PEP_ID=MMETSP0689_2-20121128/6031_1 /TAXON_ID=160604 /ORGANISM="Amphidinium massartii, Strain CS-259" /LENGTH=950 /DNA_ID=CAMNT_0020001717 /DNA_START=67 /DNA_END=2920 /DNA_ORIENTATION=+